MQPDCVFFDFDGVIVDSVDAKIRAFGELYRPFGPQVRAAVEDYQRVVPGETRFQKIPKLHRELLGIHLSPDEVQAWCAKLGRIVLNQVVASPLLPDVMSVLETLRLAGIPAHVVSGTPHDELAVIVTHKGLGPFFRSCEGAPRCKEAIVAELLATHDLTPGRCLLVGDALTDHRCAAAQGIPFVGRADPSDHPFPSGTWVVERLGETFAAPLPLLSIDAWRQHHASIETYPVSSAHTT